MDTLKANNSSASQLLSEAMVVGEHPGEPMVIHGRVKLNSNFPFEQYSKEKLLKLTQELLRTNKRLCGSFDIQQEGTPIEYSCDYGAMADLAWSSDHLNLDEFQQQQIPVSGKSLIRLKLSPQEGLCIAAHHALLDGRGLFKLQHDLLHLLLGEKKKGSLVNSNRPVKKIPLAARIRNSFYFYKNKIREIFIPPLMLSEKTSFAGSETHFLSIDFPYERIKALLSKIRVKHPKISINDILLAGLHRSIQQEFNSSAQQRQAIMMPMDLRRHGKHPDLENLSSGVNINCYHKDFNSLDSLLASVHKRSLQAQKYNFDLYTLRFLKLIKKLGILEESRRFILSKGFPRRCFKGTKHFWRFSSTAIFANIGHLKYKKSLRNIIDSVCGYPATIPPTSLAVTAFIYKDLTLNFHASSLCMTKTELQSFANKMIGALTEFEELCQETNS